MVKEPGDSAGLWTVPNAITFFRVLGIPFLLWSAHENLRGLFLVLVVTLLLSDWLDGKLASILDQRTTLGARLDSAVDALMYMAVALSFWWLEGDLIREHMGWMWGVLMSWALSAATALVRFRQLPSYHMWSAKLAWFVTAWTILLLLLTDFTAILPWTLGLVIFSNLHAVAITCTLPHWEVDVWSLRRAWQIRQGAASE